MSDFNALSTSNLMATLADQASPEDIRAWSKDVAQLEEDIRYSRIENTSLKRELVAERKNALEAMHCADWITDEQYTEAMQTLADTQERDA